MPKQGSLLPPLPFPHRPRRHLLRVVDAYSCEDSTVILECPRCHYRSDWRKVTPSEVRAGIPCPQCDGEVRDA